MKAFSVSCRCNPVVAIGRSCTTGKAVASYSTLAVSIVGRERWDFTFPIFFGCQKDFLVILRKVPPIANQSRCLRLDRQMIPQPIDKKGDEELNEATTD
jgi:hypothetical protein